MPIEELGNCLQPVTSSVTNKGSVRLDWLSTLAGLLVGTIVGITGVGGGSLMSPLLILFFGVAPVTAVGTDLWFAAITKPFGAVVHHRQKSADLGVVKWLCIGSIPAALLTLAWLATRDMHQLKGGTIVTALGVLLVLTALVTPFRGMLSRRLAASPAAQSGRYLRWQPPLTILAGAILGVLVTLTSVGAGALGATMLLLLYPVRLSSKRLVGTDIVHAIPVALVGAIGHLLIGNVNLPLLGALLLGSIPGIILGSWLTRFLSDKVVQPALAAVLLFAGIKLLL